MLFFFTDQFNNLQASERTTSPPAASPADSSNAGAFVGLGIGVTLSAILIILLLFLFWRWRKKNQRKQDPTVGYIANEGAINSDALASQAIRNNTQGSLHYRESILSRPGIEPPIATAADATYHDMQPAEGSVRSLSRGRRTPSGYSSVDLQAQAQAAAAKAHALAQFDSGFNKRSSTNDNEHGVYVGPGAGQPEQVDLSHYENH